jgi:hypothetical protein
MFNCPPNLIKTYFVFQERRQKENMNLNKGNILLLCLVYVMLSIAFAGENGNI